MKRIPVANDVVMFEGSRREYIVLNCGPAGGSYALTVLPSASIDRTTGLINEASAKTFAVYLDQPIEGLRKTLKQYKLSDITLTGTVTLKKTVTYEIVSRKDA